MTAVMKAIPGIIHDGAFAVDAETSQLLLGADAYTKKDENILEFAQAIWDRRREEAAKKLYVPGEQKLVIAK
jgi:hypothetical protein